MGRLIDADDLKAELGAACVLDVDAGVPGSEEYTPRKLIDAAPTVDAERVVHAYWVRGCHCSACGCAKPYDFYGERYEPDYCQWCGAHMDGQRKDGGDHDA